MNPQKPKSSERSPSKSDSTTQDQIDRKKESDSVDEASRESFPASDSPAWSLPPKRKRH